MNEFTKLQTQYLAGIENMSADDASRFLELLKADPEAPFRSKRIPALERHLANIKRMADAEQAWKDTWIPLALEDKATKERWLAAGASWRGWHIWTIWEYEGTEFYRWSGGFNRPCVTDEIKRVRAADAVLAELIRSKEANI